MKILSSELLMAKCPLLRKNKRVDIASLLNGLFVRALNHVKQSGKGIESTKPPVSSSSDLLPEEKMQKYHNEHKQSVKDQLLDLILNNDPSFFEHLVLKLLLALGYGYGTDAGKVVGASHDGGIDGIINEDKLGLDKSLPPLYPQIQGIISSRYSSFMISITDRISSFVRLAIVCTCRFK